MKIVGIHDYQLEATIIRDESASLMAIRWSSHPKPLWIAFTRPTPNGSRTVVAGKSG